MNIFELESKCIDPNDWKSELPEEILIKAMSFTIIGPTAVGHDDDLGWYILMSGQGPHLAWSEKNEEQ